MFLPVKLGIERLGREHVAVVLTDEVRLVHVRRDVLLLLASGCLSVVAEIVKGIYIFQE